MIVHFIELLTTLTFEAIILVRMVVSSVGWEMGNVELI